MGPVGEKATFVATSFKAPEGYELVGGDITDVEVAYGKDKDVNVKVKAIKEEKEARDVIVNFNVAPEEGQFKDPAGAKVVTYTIKEDSADQFLVPTSMDIHLLAGNYPEQQMVTGMQMQRHLELQDLLTSQKDLTQDTLL